jgi:hypothetical protein
MLRQKFLPNPFAMALGTIYTNATKRIYSKQKPNKMKPKLISLTLMIFLLAFSLCSCKKDEMLPMPNQPGGQKPQPGKLPETPNQPAHSLRLAVRASIKVGNITYDSIPAQFVVKTWDSTGLVQEKGMSLPAGTNWIDLPYKTAKVTVKMSQWAVQDEKTLERGDLNKGDTLVMTASKMARRLKEEHSFYLAQGAYHPEGRTEYHYNDDGTLFGIRFYQKLPEHQELQHNLSDRFYYAGGKLTEIKRFLVNTTNKPIVTRITYNAAGNISEMFQDSHGVTTKARFETGARSVSIFHSYNNGHSMTYSMDLSGGNKVKEHATTSRGGGEEGSFQYDQNINPYAHMNYPDLLLSKISKNNVTAQQKSYTGAFPSLVPYKYEYTYDAAGYPVQLLKHFKSGITGEYLSTKKIVFTYATN